MTPGRQRTAGLPVSNKETETKRTKNLAKHRLDFTDAGMVLDNHLQPRVARLCTQSMYAAPSGGSPARWLSQTMLPRQSMVS